VQLRLIALKMGRTKWRHGRFGSPSTWSEGLFTPSCVQREVSVSENDFCQPPEQSQDGKEAQKHGENSDGP
jgi:hypothetical protein